jgi:hypothetical protein
MSLPYSLFQFVVINPSFSSSKAFPLSSLSALWTSIGCKKSETHPFKHSEELIFLLVWFADNQCAVKVTGASGFFFLETVCTCPAPSVVSHILFTDFCYVPGMWLREQGALCFEVSRISPFTEM